MEEYKIGEILTSVCDVEVERAISGERVVIPKGNRIIIGPDKYAHHLRDGMLQPLPEGTKVEGYDTTGLAEYLCMVLTAHFPIEEMLADYDLERDALREEIECALDEIGF